MYWANENAIFPPHQSFIGISLENPEFVKNDHCRHDACVTIPASFVKEKHISIQFKNLDDGQYALYSLYDESEKLNLAYKYMLYR
ncbi:hypothetical protein GCM10011384_00220 [Psychrobacillus lasiicapitis]|nr:hypothetical protein GCM10011384_00220 [Psychrobacillus lasiicapitis]